MILILVFFQHFVIKMVNIVIIITATIAIHLKATSSVMVNKLLPLLRSFTHPHYHHNFILNQMLSMVTLSVLLAIITSSVPFNY